MSITSQTYSFLSDPNAPELPPSVMMVSAEHIKARCQQLAVLPEFKSHPADNQPLELTKLTASAHRLVLEAAAFGDARDQAAAGQAERAAVSLEAVWVAGAVAPAPAPEIPEMEEPGPVGRPMVGSQICHWRELDGGRCVPAVVTKVHRGSWSLAAAVSPESPYLELVDLIGDRSHPLNARWIPQPKPDLTPGMRPVIHSWHRRTPHECPTLRRG